MQIAFIIYQTVFRWTCPIILCRYLFLFSFYVCFAILRMKLVGLLVLIAAAAAAAVDVVVVVVAVVVLFFLYSYLDWLQSLICFCFFFV
jgi:hypothetical protein